jgi:hypothetical protein
MSNSFSGTAARLIRPLILGSAPAVFMFAGLALADSEFASGTAQAWQSMPISNPLLTRDTSVCREYQQVHVGGHAEGPLPSDAVRCLPISFLLARTVGVDGN